MSAGAQYPLARQATVVVFSEASAAALETAVNTWLAAAGERKLLAPIVARSDGTAWYATAFYSE